MSLVVRWHFVFLLLLPLAAQQYTFEPFSLGEMPTYAQSINNRGAIVGYYAPPTNYKHAFKRHANGTVELLNLRHTTLLYDSLTLVGINNFGDMVGTAEVTLRGITMATGFHLSGGSPGFLAT